MRSIPFLSVVALATAAFFSVAFLACKTEKTPTIDLQIDRFERELFSLDTNQIDAGVAALEKKWPQFVPLFAKNVIGDPQNPNETTAQSIGIFVKSPEMVALNDSIQRVFADFSAEKKALEAVFSNYKKQFPEKAVPRVLTVSTGYSYGVFPASDSVFCIGLDFFLGKNHPAYTAILDMPDYVRARLDRKYIASQTAEALAADLVGAATGQRFLDHLISNGKVFLVKNALLPDAPDSIKYGFSARQLAALEANEAELWAYVLEKKLTFSTRWDDFKKLVSESPNAGDSPPALREMPGRSANWLGMRILQNYQKKTGASLAETLEKRDPQAILEQAKYKPRKR